MVTIPNFNWKTSTSIKFERYHLSFILLFLCVREMRLVYTKINGFSHKRTNKINKNAIYLRFCIFHRTVTYTKKVIDTSSWRRPVQSKFCCGKGENKVVLWWFSSHGLLRTIKKLNCFFFSNTEDKKSSKKRNKTIIIIILQQNCLVGTTKKNIIVFPINWTFLKQICTFTVLHW